MIAFKYDRVSRVAPIFYIESVFSLMFDYFVFSVQFGWMQMLGIALVFSMFTAKFVVAFLNTQND